MGHLDFAFAGARGIWENTSDATDVNSTCAMDGLLVTGDDMRTVRMYNFPCLPERSTLPTAGTIVT